MNAVDIVGCKEKRYEAIPYLVEVSLPEPTESSFLQIRETLTRIGIAVKREGFIDTLYQTCHILAKRGKHFIVHFKTMFVLDGRKNNLTVGDIARQNLIIQLLEEWGMVDVVNPSMIDDPVVGMGALNIIAHKDKHNWQLTQKYNIGFNRTKK